MEHAADPSAADGARAEAAVVLANELVTEAAARERHSGRKAKRRRDRMAMLVRDSRVYGGLLAQQRHTDLGGTEPGFLERLRKK